MAATRVDGAAETDALLARHAVRLQCFLGESAQCGGLQKLSSSSTPGSSAAATAALGLIFDGSGERKGRQAVLFTPRDYLPAHGDVGDQRLALERLVRVGRGVVLLEPVLNVLAVVRVAIGGNDGVVHENALERHILQLLCRQTASGSASTQRVLVPCF